MRWLSDTPDPVETLDFVLSAPRLGPRMRHALLLLIEGASYREATELAGLRPSRVADVYRQARKVGLRELQAVRKRQRQACMISEREAAVYAAWRRGDPTTMSLRQLHRTYSVASDRQIRMLEAGQ